MRIPLPYTVRNNLQKFLKIEQARRTLQTGEKVNLIEIEKEVGEHCSLTRDAIFSIKRGTSIASLPVAFKLADFFGTTIEQLFVVIDKKDEEVKIEEDEEEIDELSFLKEEEKVEHFDEEEQLNLL